MTAGSWVVISSMVDRDSVANPDPDRYDASMSATVGDRCYGTRPFNPPSCGMSPDGRASMAITMTTMITTAGTGITRPAVVVFRG